MSNSDGNDSKCPQFILASNYITLYLKYFKCPKLIETAKAITWPVCRCLYSSAVVFVNAGF